MFKHLFACLGLLAACLGQDPLIVLKEFNYSRHLNDDLTPQRMAALDDDRFVLLDQKTNELFVFSYNGIVHQTGGFGQGGESFSEPVDLIVHNLQIWVCDRYENAVKRFDYKLNYLGIDQIQSNEYDPFYPDLITADLFGKAHVFSRHYGQLLSMDNSIRALIDLNQYGIDGQCIIDLKTDNAGNIALLSCENEIVLFNRFGRKLSTSLVQIVDPTNIVHWTNDWIVLNSEGNIETLSGESNDLPIYENESVLDVDVQFKHLIILTDQRILVLKRS